MIIDNIDLSKEYKYDLILCRSYDREEIVILSEALNFQYNAKLSEYNEIEFDIPKYINNKKGEKIENENYDLILDGYLILVNNREYFIIEGLEDNGGSKDYKHIVAYGYEKTINQRSLIDFEGTYQIYPDNIETGYGVLERFIEDNPEWSVGYIDDKVRKDNTIGQNHNKYRTFEIPEKSWYLFLTEDFSTSFNCLVKFDTLNMTINLYDKDIIGENKGLYISEKNYLKSIKKKIASDKIVTRLVCFGKNALTFNEVNPTGQSWIHDYTHYRDLKYMPADLLDKFNAYDNLIESKQGEFNNLLTQINIVNGQIIDAEAQLLDLNSQLNNIKTQIAVAIATKSLDGELLKIELENKQSEINTKESEISGLNTQLDSLHTEKANLVDSLSFKSNFNSEQLKIINKYGLYTTWKNDTIINKDDLFTEGKKALQELNTPIIEIEIDNVDFLKIVECQEDWDKLVMGDIVNIEYSKLGIDINLRLIEYTHNPQKSTSLKMTFSNKLFKNDISRQIGNGISRAVSSGNIISKKKYIWDLAEANNMSIQDIMNNNLDLMRQSVTNSDNTVSIDRNGILLMDRTNNMNQMYITNGVLGISTDGGESFRLGICAEGIVAEAIVGRILMSEKLYIQNANASMTINEDGISIAGNLIKITGGLTDEQIASATYWNSIENNITNYTNTQIELTNNKISLKADKSITDGLNTRLSSAEQKITADAIVTTVRTSSLYNSDLSIRDARISNVESSITQQSDQIALKVSKSEMASQITQNADSIKIAMGQIGGNNLLKDSNFTLGYSINKVYCNWCSAWLGTIDNKLSLQLGSNTTGQDVFATLPIPRLIPGGTYTFSFKFLTSDSVTQDWIGRVGVQERTGQWRWLGYAVSTGFSYDFTFKTYSFKISVPSDAAVDNLAFVMRPNVLNGNYCAYTDLKLEEGNNVTAWSPNANEIKGATYTFDGDNFTMTNKNYTTILSPTGIAQCDNIFANDNVDSSNPLSIPFNIDSETNRVDKILLKIQPQNFRAYSKGALSGGGSTQTSSGGGDHRHLMFHYTGTSVQSVSPFYVYYGQNNASFYANGALDDIYTWGSSGSHSHSVTFSSHSHGIDYGIFEQSSSAYNMSVVIDGTTRITGLSGAQILDITQWLTTSGWHTVQITSSQNGRIAANLYIKSYVGY